MGGQRLERGDRLWIGGRAEERERDHSAGKRIEGEAVASPIEEKGAVATPGAGLERKVDWLAHRTSG